MSSAWGEFECADCGLSTRDPEELWWDEEGLGHCAEGCEPRTREDGYRFARPTFSGRDRPAGEGWFCREHMYFL